MDMPLRSSVGSVETSLEEGDKRFSNKTVDYLWDRCGGSSFRDIQEAPSPGVVLR